MDLQACTLDHHESPCMYKVVFVTSATHCWVHACIVVCETWLMFHWQCGWPHTRRPACWHGNHLLMMPQHLTITASESWGKP